MSAQQAKASRKDTFMRSVSDSHAAAQSQGVVQKQFLSNTSFDDTAAVYESPYPKFQAAMSSSNSLPNLAALNSEPVPDVSDWAEFDLPFDIFESLRYDSQENLSTSGRPPADSASSSASKRRAAAKLHVGIADKAQFFRKDSATIRQPNMPPRANGSTEEFRGSQSHSFSSTFLKSDSSMNVMGNNVLGALLPSSGSTMDVIQKSSSASVDTRDSMRELAKKVAPVNRDGVEFAPLGDDMHLSILSSYSMSVDDALAHAPPGDKKLESFSMSSWSQHTIPGDLFDSNHSSAVKASAARRDREGLLARIDSERSMTEAMLDDYAWRMDSVELETFDHISGIAHYTEPPRLTQQALRHHTQEESAPSGARAGRGGRNGRGAAAAPKAKARANTDGDLQLDTGAPQRAAAVPIEPSPSAAPQFPYPSAFLGNLGRSNSGPGPGTASTASSADVSQSSSYVAGQNQPVLAPVYDPNTGIIYYPHLPPGASLPAGAGQAPAPAHLLPLPVRSDSKRGSFTDSRGIPTPPYLSDDGSIPEAPQDDGHYPVRRQSGGYAQFEIGAPPPSGGSTPGSNTTTPRTSNKKERNRGSYRCGRCGKPKVNHVCAFVDTTTLVGASVQASGPVINPQTMQPFAGDRVLTVTPHRKSIMIPLEAAYEQFGMVEQSMSQSGSFRLASGTASGQTTDLRSSSSAQSDLRGIFARSTSSGVGACLSVVAESNDDLTQGLSSSSGSTSSRPSVAFTQPLAQIPEQKELAQLALEADSNDDIFFPTEFPPNAGLVFNGSRNSSVNSTYGNESDTSSAYGDNQQQRSSFATMLNNVPDLGLSKFFTFK